MRRRREGVFLAEISHFGLCRSGISAAATPYLTQQRRQRRRPFTIHSEQVMSVIVSDVDVQMQKNVDENKEKRKSELKKILLGLLALN